MYIYVYICIYIYVFIYVYINRCIDVYIRICIGIYTGRDCVGGRQQSSNRVSGISTKTIHQFTTPSLPRTIYWNGTTSALQPEEITSKRTRVSCVYYQ